MGILFLPYIPMDHPIFQKIPQLQIIICRQCKHGVHPREINTHLRKKHYMKSPEIQSIIKTMQQWDDIIQDPAAVHVPRALDNPLPVIPVHTNGGACG